MIWKLGFEYSGIGVRCRIARCLSYASRCASLRKSPVIPTQSQLQRLTSCHLRRSYDICGLAFGLWAKRKGIQRSGLFGMYRFHSHLNVSKR